MLTALPFLFEQLFPLIFVALVPLLLATAPATAGVEFTRGWIMGAVTILTGFWWVPATIARFEGFGLPLALPFFALFVAYYALQFALFTAVTAALRRRGSSWVPSPLVIASVWTLLEWGFPKVIPWYLGDSLASAVLLRQAADSVGVHGLSFLILICWLNALLAKAIAQRHLRPLLTAAVVLLTWLAYGAVSIRSSASGDGFAITIIQGA